MAFAEDEVKGLEKVLTRLALTEEGSLEKVLSKLLPVVIQQLKSPHEATRKKVMEILAHVNKRIKGTVSIQLPLGPLLELFRKSDAMPLVKNFALVYVDMAFRRAPSDQQFAQVGPLLENLGNRSRQHQDMLLQMAVCGLSCFSVMPHARPQSEDFCSRFAFLREESSLRTFLEFALQTLLFQPPQLLSSGPRNAHAHQGLLSALGSAPGRLPASSQQNGGTEAQTPPGLSPALMQRVAGKSPPGADELVRKKLGILNFTEAAHLDVQSVMLHYLVAASDPQDPVSRRGDELLRRRCALDSGKPSVDLEDTALISRLFSLLLGTPDVSSLAAENRIAPAAPGLAVRIMGVFCRSLAAANHFPAALQAIFSCVYGEASTLRLKQAGMEFAVWVFKHATKDNLLPAAPGILEALLRLLQQDGGRDVTASERLRGFTYQALGQLGSAAPETLRLHGAELPRNLFASLTSDPPGVRASLQEALSSLASAYKGVSGEAEQEIRALLLDAIANPSNEGARYCAVQWATKLFPFHDVTARYVCILAAADAKLEIREAGLQGLEPPKPSTGGNVKVDSSYPEAAQLMRFLQERHPQLRRPPQQLQSLVLPARAFSTLITFLRTCRHCDKTRRADSEVLPDADADLLDSAYYNLLEHALIRDGTSDLHLVALQALLDAAGDDITAFAGHYSDRLSWLHGFVGHIHPTAREVAGKLLGIVTSQLASQSVVALLGDLSSAIPLAKSASESGSRRFEDQVGALTALGYVIAQASTGTPAVDPAAMTEATKKLATTLKNPTPAIAAAAASALGHAGLQRPLTLSVGIKSTASDTGTSEAEKMEVDVTLQSLDTPTRLSVVDDIKMLLAGKDAKAAVSAATALGHIALGDEEPVLLDCVVAALMGTVANKSEPLQFAIGEALCFVCGGIPVSADTILTTNYTSLSSHLTSVTSSTGPSASEVPAAQISDVRKGLQERILKQILEEHIFHSRPEVRTAACLWLVSLVSFTGKQDAVMRQLTAISEAFSHLLGDSSEVTQEMASRGMTQVYSLGDESSRQELLGSLMGTLQGGAKRKRAVKVTGQTQIFEEGQLGEVPGGGSLTTYRELCSLATEMGQPDLLYKFLDLANHASSLNSSRGAAFGFASIAKIAGEQLEPYIAKLTPKLYRYLYDPNPRVRDAMTHIWRTLVAEPKKAIDANFDAILTELLRDMGGRLWRNREAACYATADLLQGRKWAEVGRKLEDVWTLAFRALDDIKESVRAAALGLVRGLRSLTLRLCDPAHTPSKDASEAIALSLPLLLQRGVMSSVGEVQGIALVTISKLVEQAGGDLIRPHLSHLVPAMLESLSGMEDARLNYVEQHADRLGLDGGRLDALRVSAAASSPMGDTLDLCQRYTNAEAISSLLPALSQLIRRGTGLNTRVGTSKFVAGLATRLGSDIKPHAAPLIKALIGAARLESSTAVRRAYASAAAQVARHAPEPRVQKLVAEAVEMYREPGDQKSRQLAGLLLRELSRKAPDAFSAHAGQIMPAAFIARKDEEGDVAALWGEAWSEGCTSDAAALRLYASDIVPLITEGLASQQWGRKKACALAVTSLCDDGADSLPPHVDKLADALLQEVPGRIWEGKESIIQALGSLSKATPAELSGSGSQAIVEALLSILPKRKAVLRTAALQALETTLDAMPGEFYASAAPPLLIACLSSKAPPKEGNEEGDEEKSLALPLEPVVKCLTVLWDKASPDTVMLHGEQHAQALGAALSPAGAWPARLAALTGAQKYGVRLQKEGLEAATKAAWARLLLAGVLSATEETRYSQIRGAALDVLEQLIPLFSEEGEHKAVRDLEDIRTAVERMAGGERSPALIAKASDIAALLPVMPMAVD